MAVRYSWYEPGTRPCWLVEAKNFDVDEVEMVLLNFDDKDKELLPVGRVVSSIGNLVGE